jgi:hypothetical protein
MRFNFNNPAHRSIVNVKRTGNFVLTVSPACVSLRKGAKAQRRNGAKADGVRPCKVILLY